MRNCASGNLEIVLRSGSSPLDSGFDASHRPGMTGLPPHQMTAAIQIVLADPLIALADFAGLPCDEKFSCGALGISMRMH
jgi:hypothetical protein